MLLCSYYSTVPVFFYERGGNIHLIIIKQYLSYLILRFEVPSNALLVYISTLSSALHMYVCIYVWSSHIAQSMDQPGKVANSVRGQLNRENEYSPVPVSA